MGSKITTRRDFVKLTTLGVSGLVALDQSTQRTMLRIVCIGAHPGDPEFGCGGTLARYANAGHEVNIIYLTRGEAGDPSKTFAQSAALRSAEAGFACKALKAKPLFAGQTDANTVLDKSSIESLVKIISSLKPDILFTHWPVDAHPDHQVSGMLGLNAWVKLNQTFDLFYYEVNTGSETMAFEPTDYVDITAVRDQKKAAMFAHRSQNAAELYETLFKTLEEFRGYQAGVKAAEAFIHFKPKPGQSVIRGL